VTVVAVDGRSLAGGARGVGHYLGGMLGALEVEARVVLPRGARLEPRPGVAGVHNPAPSRLLHGAGAITGRPRLDRLAGGADVVWLPAPAPVAVGDVPIVLTVHDLSFLERPGDFTRYERLWHRLARPAALARRAAVVVAVTEDTAARLRERLGIEAIVVGAGAGDPGPPAGPEAVEAVRRRYGLPERYFLFVGALEPRKAVDRLVAALPRGEAVVLAGTGRLAGSLRGPGVHVLGPVGRADKGALLAGARAVVLPSWNEGYGYPPLEGYAHGTPAIVSDLPALRETAGGGAVYVPPGDVAALADALRELANDEPRRRQLAERGAAALDGRTWATSARALRAVLEEAAA
jgi:glycosyltransferase involved in cell wall biosynthesis